MEIRSKILQILIDKKINNDEGDGIIGFNSFGELEFEQAIINTILYIQNKIDTLPRGNLSEKQELYLLITRYEDALREYKEKKKEFDKMFTSSDNEKDIVGTARQSALAFYYMQRAKAFPRKSGAFTTDARFLRFLTGHNYDTLKDVISHPDKRKSDKTGKGTKSLIDNLKIVLEQFNLIRFTEGIKLIENDINTLQNDLDTFNEI